MKGKKAFNAETQYAMYLEGMGLKESEMHPKERRERKLAFMAGLWQTLLLIKIAGNDTEITEQEFGESLEEMENQAEAFIRSQ